MQSRRVLMLLSLAAPLLGGCSDERRAKETFASRFTCPEERVTTTVRKDLDPIPLMTHPERPPQEIAADPQRLALWKERDKARVSDWAGKTVVQARGCDHEALYVCGQLRVSVGATRPGCRDAELPPH